MRPVSGGAAAGMTAWRRHPAALWRSTSMGPVVLAPGLDVRVRLGAVAWELLDRPADAARVADAATAAGGPAVSVGSAAEALDELARAGLVVPA